MKNNLIFEYSEIYGVLNGVSENGIVIQHVTTVRDCVRVTKYEWS